MINQEVVIGIDIGGTSSKIGVVDQLGEVLAYRSFSSYAQDSFDRFLKTLEDQVRLLKKDVGHEVQYRAVGMGAPDINSKTGCMIHPPNFKWGDEVPLLKSVSDLLQLPGIVSNDANVSAIGEMKFGAAKGLENFIVLTLGTGLGSGIVANGKLVEGKAGFAGELGHLNVKPDGRQCMCGLRGCLETYASATGICRTVFKLMADTPYPSVLRAHNFHELNASMITEAAIGGDRLARKAFKYTGKILGHKMADMAAFLDPEAIILAGGLTKAGDWLLKPVIKEMEKHLFHAYKGNVRVLISSVSGANAAVVGAAGLAWDFCERQESAGQTQTDS